MKFLKFESFELQREVFRMCQLVTTRFVFQQLKCLPGKAVTQLRTAPRTLTNVSRDIRKRGVTGWRRGWVFTHCSQTDLIRRGHLILFLHLSSLPQAGRQDQRRKRGFSGNICNPPGWRKRNSCFNAHLTTGHRENTLLSVFTFNKLYLSSIYCSG